MSLDALVWAFAQPVKPATNKFVLVALADHANSSQGVWLVWPSIAHLAAKTSLERKTVIRAIAQLCASGLLRDTGERRGRTGSIRVFAINHNQAVPKTDQLEAVPLFPVSCPKNGTGKLSQKRHTESGRRNQEENRIESGRFDSAVKALFAAWNDNVPSLPPATESLLRGSTTIRDRILAASSAVGVEWPLVFAGVEASDFLTGRNGQWRGRPCTLLWVLGHLDQLAAGAYANPANGRIAARH